MPNHKYVIKVDDEVVWEGQDPRERFWEIHKKNQNRKVAISWVSTKEDILIV